MHASCTRCGGGDGAGVQEGEHAPFIHDLCATLPKNLTDLEVPRARGAAGGRGAQRAAAAGAGAAAA